MGKAESNDSTPLGKPLADFLIEPESDEAYRRVSGRVLAERKRIVRDLEECKAVQTDIQRRRTNTAKAIRRVVEIEKRTTDAETHRRLAMLVHRLSARCAAIGDAHRANGIRHGDIDDRSAALDKLVDQIHAERAWAVALRDTPPFDPRDN